MADEPLFPGPPRSWDFHTEAERKAYAAGFTNGVNHPGQTPALRSTADQLEVVFDGPAAESGSPDPIRVRVRINGIDLGEAFVQQSWWERIRSAGWMVSVVCHPKGAYPHTIGHSVRPSADGPKHSPAEVCDCPNPRPGKPFHCAVGVPSDRS